MKRTALATTLISVLLFTLSLVAYIPILRAVTETPQVQWSRTYTRLLDYSVNGYPVSAVDKGCSVIQTVDGGYALFALLNDVHYAPHSGGVDNRTGMVIKTDSLGNVQWEKGNLTINTLSYFMFQTDDSGFLLSGFGYNSDYNVVKLDSGGNLEWSKNFDCMALGGIQTSDGGYVLAGYIPNYNSVAILLKVDGKGNLLMNKTFPASSGRSGAYAIAETDAGGYAIVGERDGAWLAVIDSDGNLIISQTYAELDGFFSSIALSEDGGFILVGGSFLHPYEEALIAHVDSTGKLMWNKIINNPLGENGVTWSFLSIAVIHDGSYVTTGIPDAEGSVLFIFDASGNLQWNDTNSNAEAPALFTQVTATNDGGFAVVGTTQDNSAWLAKFALESVTPPDETSPQITTTWIVVAVTVVIVVGGSLLVYFKKRKHNA
jgi:hypothetical protein